MSARRVTAHVQATWQRFSESGSSDRFRLDQKTLEALVALLSHSLQAAIAGQDFKQGPFSRVDAEAGGGTHSGGSLRKGSATSSSCTLEGALSAQQVVQLVTAVLEMPADLLLVRRTGTSSSPP